MFWVISMVRKCRKIWSIFVVSKLKPISVDLLALKLMKDEFRKCFPQTLERHLNLAHDYN